MRIPKSYYDLTIKDFDNLKSVNDIEDPEEKRKAQYCILLDIDDEQLSKLDIYQQNEIANSLLFLNGQPKADFKRVIEIDGIKYGFINKLQHMSMGEWVDLDYYSMEFETEKHRLASVLYRRIVKEDELGYYIEPYDGDIAARTAEIFQEKMSYQDVWGASVFFSIIEAELLRYFPEYLTQLDQMKMSY